MHLLPHNYVCKYDSLLLTSFGGFLVGLVFFWQALLVLHYYRACVALGE